MIFDLNNSICVVPLSLGRDDILNCPEDPRTITHQRGFLAKEWGYTIDPSLKSSSKWVYQQTEQKTVRLESCLLEMWGNHIKLTSVYKWTQWSFCHGPLCLHERSYLGQWPIIPPSIWTASGPFVIVHPHTMVSPGGFGIGHSHALLLHDKQPIFYILCSTHLI